MISEIKSNPKKSIWGGVFSLLDKINLKKALTRRFIFHPPEPCKISSWPWWRKSLWIQSKEDCGRPNMFWIYSKKCQENEYLSRLLFWRIQNLFWKKKQTLSYSVTLHISQQVISSLSLLKKIEQFLRTSSSIAMAIHQTLELLTQAQ